MAKFISWELVLPCLSRRLHHRLYKKEVPVGAGTSFGALFLAVAFRVSLQAADCFEFFDSVGLLPGEVGVFSAKVTVGCRLFVDGATQI